MIKLPNLKQIIRECLHKGALSRYLFVVIVEMPEPTSESELYKPRGLALTGLAWLKFGPTKNWYVYQSSRNIFSFLFENENDAAMFEHYLKNRKV